MTAVVLGTGPDLPPDRLDALREYFTIGVNRVWKHTDGLRPTVGFWIDGGIYEENPEWFDATLPVCDASAEPDWRAVNGRRPITIPARGGPLPVRYEDLDPRILYHRPNTGVVAALWATSLGCWPVILLGMGCEDDGRRPDQLYAMRAALHEALSRNYRRPGEWRNTLWPWPRCVVENPVMWTSYLHSQRLRPCSDTTARRNLQTLYVKNDGNRRA